MTEQPVDIPMIELFGQHSWHSVAAIRLNAAGARALMGALQRFLERQEQSFAVFASDGEGYSLHLIPGNLHDDLNANHYLDAPGLKVDDGERLVQVVAEVAA